VGEAHLNLAHYFPDDGCLQLFVAIRQGLPEAPQLLARFSKDLLHLAGTALQFM
jgi:hypothetical protein